MTLAVCVGLMIMGLPAVSAWAVVIAPSGATGTPPSYGSPTYLINGTGLSGAGPVLAQPHNTTHTQGWLINNTNPANELVFQMPGARDLSGAHIWQYSQGTCCTGRGVSSFDMSFSSDGGATYPTTLAGLTLAPASGTSQETAQTLAFTPQTGVTHVKFNNMADFPTLPSPGWQGLNEVRFEAAPVPLTGTPVGNTLTPRDSATDGSPHVLYSNFVPMPATGEVAGVSTYTQGSALDFNMYQLRPTGTPNQYDVVYDSGTIRPSGGAGSVEGHRFPNGPTTVHPGDVFAHHGQAIPFSMAGGTNAANPQVIYYPSPAPPTQGSTIALGQGGFPLFNQPRDYASAVDFTPLPTVAIGQDLTNRASRDGGTGNLFAAEVFGFNQGRAVDWSIRGHTAPYGGTRNITPVILEQTGAGGLGAMTIRGIGTPRTLGHSADVQTFSFGLTSGSDQMGPRHYLGWIDSDGGQARNQGIISYSDPSDHFTLWLGGPAPIHVGDTRSVTNLNRRYSLQATFDVGRDEVVGNGASQRAHVDGAVGAVFVADDPFTQLGNVSQWAFWGWEGNRWITPLILEEEADGSYLLRGVGTSRLAAGGQGTMTYDFGLLGGSGEVDANHYFGWVDASIGPDGTPIGNQGVIRYADDETFSAQARWFGSIAGAGAFTPGADFGGGTLLPRAYSVQAIATFIPEPATLTLLGLGALALLRRRRRR